MKQINLILCLILMVGLSASEQFDNITLNDESLLRSVLWHQTAAEYNALCYQAYNIATEIIHREANLEGSKEKAIIVDIDETVINNSYYNAREIFSYQKYPDDFYKYIDEATGTAIAGATEFLNLADSLGYQIFYITNRRERAREGTEKNLMKLDYPQVFSDHVFCKTDVSSKQPRRDIVKEKYDIVLLMGDNLIDFSSLFEADTISGRREAVDLYRDYFGDKFIILPNVMHGTWAKAIYNFDRSLSKEEIRNLMIKHVDLGK